MIVKIEMKQKSLERETSLKTLSSIWETDAGIIIDDKDQQQAK
jgi:hypothetical protein